MRYFDLHCDTIYRLTDFEQRLPAGENLLQNTGHVDLRRAGSLEQYAQVFALFCGYQPVASQQDAHQRLTRMLDTARSAFAANGSRLRHCTCAADFLEAQAQRQAAAFLSIEGAELLQTEADLQLALHRALRLVQEHYADWTVRDAARACGLSYSYFSRSFKQLFGISFCTYLERLRLLEAERLLLTTGSSVGEIALETGFGTASYFTQCFRKRYGVAPGKFRTLGRSADEQ